MPDPFPLNETALQAASLTLQMDSRLSYESTTRAAILTYLREAGFEVEFNHPQQPRRRQRLVGPWVPIDTQAAAEETTRRIEREHSAGDTKTFNDPADAAAYLRNEPIDTVEKED